MTIVTLVAGALLRASLSQVDPMWVLSASLQALACPELEVRWAAVMALGHLVRRYRHIDINPIVTAVTPLREDPRLSGKVDDLLGDITIIRT